MDADLYDEFGNYIGPELDSDDDDDDDEDAPFAGAQKAEDENEEEEETQVFLKKLVSVILFFFQNLHQHPKEKIIRLRVLSSWRIRIV